MKLSDDAFRSVVRHAPLVAIEFAITNERGEHLLGLRRNAPAKGSWFHLGGRVRKDETLDDAFARLSEEETGVRVAREEAELLGVYEHMYPDNFFAEPGFGTHYVVLGHRLDWRGRPAIDDRPQHSSYRWWSVEDLLASPDVHENAKLYFTGAGR